MAPPFRLNRNAVARDALLRPYELQGPYAGQAVYDLYNFEAPAAVVLEALARRFIDPRDAQNNSPPARKLLAFAARWPDAITVEGYAVSPRRNDCRVTIVGLQLDLARVEPSERLAAWREFRTFSRSPGYPPDTFVDRVERGELVMRAWWD